MIGRAMAFTVKPSGDIVCDTAEEAVALARALGQGQQTKQVVGESITTDRWQKVHAKDKRISAAVERLKAGREFFGDLTPLQRQACEMRIAGKWPHEIAAELGRTTGTIQAIIWDAGKRLRRRAKGESLPTQAEISSMGGKAAKAKRDAARAAAAPTVDVSSGDNKKARRCGKCGRPGHNARKCPGVAAATDGAVKKPAETIPKVFQPPPARLYVVSEDFEEEDGTAWIEGDVWEALEPTGETVDEHQQFKMRRQGDGAEGVGFPSLHPFVAHDARPNAPAPHQVKIQRVGLGRLAASA